MMRNLMKFASIPVFATALALAACADQQGSNPLTGVGEATFGKTSTGTAGWGKGGKKANGPQVTGVAADGTVRSWRIGTGKLPDPTNLKGDATIGREGGYIFTQGHVLLVPPGAVTEPTYFKIQAQNVTSVETVPVAVELKAYRIAATGETIDVGEQGFQRPVYLAMSYEWAQETLSIGLTGATVVWVKAPGSAEEVRTRTIDYNGKWIVAELSHFSIYGLAWPE
ncbi:MAG: hypothetical protein KY464_15145 [Gemmatimonadetes bacterium]|nr:hypothetical protein [Gemmatimonadota bacterium]